MKMRRWSVAAVWMMTPVWLLLGVAGNAIADWDPIEDATASFTGNQYYGGQIALAEVRFLPSGSQVAELTLLIAATSGEDAVRLYSFDTSSGDLELEDEVTVSATGIDDPIAWTPTFMSLDAVVVCSPDSGPPGLTQIWYDLGLEGGIGDEAVLERADSVCAEAGRERGACC